MTKIFDYDVFLSYSSKDKPVVKELAERLKEDGLRVWFDEWEIQPGDMISLKVEEGLEKSRSLVLAMSEDAFQSDWVTLERHTALFRDPNNSERRFVPLRLDDAVISDVLKQFAYIDWRTRSIDQYSRLMATCRRVAKAKKSGGTSRPAEILKGHGAGVSCVAMTPDGRRLISGSSDKVALVWDLMSKKRLSRLKGYSRPVTGVAVAQNGSRLFSISMDGMVWVWDLEGGRLEHRFNGRGGQVLRMAVTPNGQRSILDTGRELELWDPVAPRFIRFLKGYWGTRRQTFRNSTQLSLWELPDNARPVSLYVGSLEISADGKLVIAGDIDGQIRIWSTESGDLESSFGYGSSINSIAMTSDMRHVISGSFDGAVRVWDRSAAKPIVMFEGHTGAVSSVAVTADGRFIVSGSVDKTVRVWDIDTGALHEKMSGHLSEVTSVAVTADGRIAVSGSRDGTVRIWNLSLVKSKGEQAAGDARYTNAKVLLVGDSGVGKSGLAYRLAEGRFVSTVSTDAAWATQLKLPDEESRKGNIEREIWLWDFAGQADYRLIHQLYMDETALAVLVFNPQSENPFEGLGQWDRDLVRAARRPFLRKLLVAGRCDRGGLMVSRVSLERFCQERGYVDYLETSAYTGAGCGELRESIIQSISWDEIPWTSSPRVFRILKEQIVKLKDEGRVALLRTVELKQQLEMRLLRDRFSSEDLRAVVGLLAGPGVVWQLEFGDFVLLQPERINAYAAAVIRSVRAHTDEIGCILEEYVLEGYLDYQDMQRLSRGEEQIVLRAMHQTFVDHGLCLRERTDQGMLLVFPSYFKRERPELEDHPAVLVSYQFKGALEEIYATLVVRLHHTTTFDKAELWRFAADFKTPSGKRAGFKVTRRGEGAADLAVYFEPGVPDDTKVTFIRYVHEHLQAKALDVLRLRHYICMDCHTPVENRKTAWDRLSRGLHDIVCVNCEKRVPLWDLIEEKFASEEFQQRVRELEEQARMSIDSESRELILVGHAFAIAGEAGQIFRPTPNSDWGLDGEIEFKDLRGKASGQRVYLQLKSGDSYLYKRRKDGEEVFTIKNPRHAEYWQQHAYPVMLVIRTSDGEIRWMNVTEYLQRQAGEKVKQIIFKGEPFTALNLQRLRDRVLAS